MTSIKPSIKNIEAALRVCGDVKKIATLIKKDKLISCGYYYIENKKIQKN